MKKYLDYDGAKVLVDQALEEFAPIDHKHNVDDIEGYVGGDSTQSDWNQSDDTAPDYVKNRTHYVDGELVETPVFENITFTPSANATVTSDIVTSGNVKVVWDGVEYICEGMIGNQFGGIGNASLYMPYYDNTGEPFFMGFFAGGEPDKIIVADDQVGTEHTYSIYTVEDTRVYYTLDEKFIPDTIAHVEDLVQSDWNENDETSLAYIQNRIGGYTVDNAEVVYIDNEEFDFTTSNSKHLVFPPEYESAFRLGNQIIVIFNGTEYICEVNEGTFYGMSTIVVGNASFIPEGWGTDTGEPFVFFDDPTDANWSFRVKENSKHTITIKWIGIDTVKIPLQMLESVGKKYKPWNSGEIFNGYTINVADGMYSHAEGYRTIATGNYGHAEGYQTTSSGDYSHAEGHSTIANGENQHAQGKYNMEDTENKYAHIVGNGEDEDNRSNAHTLDWQGNGWYAGSLYVGGTSQDDAVRVATLDDIAKYNQITMVDEDNGYDYVVAMKNGSLVSYCACTSIAITTLPSKTEYASGDVFDPTDMVVTATCQDGNTRVITNYTYTETVTASTVVISYVERGITYTAEVTVTIV